MDDGDFNVTIKDVFDVIITSGVTGLIAFAKYLHGRVDSNKQDLADFKLHVAKTHPTNDSVEKRFDKVDEKLDKIDEKLERLFESN